MARCRECSAKVWRNAEYCPHCGARHPAKPHLMLTTEQERSRFYISTPIGILVLVVIGIVYAASHNGSGASVQSDTCKSDWTRCVDNSDLVNNYLDDHSAQFDCKTEATKLAKYGDPKFPWPFVFDTFYKGNDYLRTGIAILIEKNAQYQTEFGAMVHTEVTCTYDLRAKKVLSINIAAE